MGARRKGREAALQILYQVDTSEVSPEDALRTFWTHLGPTPEGGMSEAQDFANVLVRGWAKSREAIDAKIKDVSHHWRLERMARVDRNILRLATFELLEMPDIPARVTLNEAVELAKRFGGEGSAKFVNGVLDRIATDVGKA